MMEVQYIVGRLPEVPVADRTDTFLKPRACEFPLHCTGLRSVQKKRDADRSVS